MTATFPKGYDLTDYLVEHGADALRRLLLEAPEPPTVEQALDAKAATNGHHKTPPEVEEWGPVLPLEDPRPNMPIFPVAALPPWLRNWCSYTAEIVQAPVDIAAMYGLAAISTAIAGKVRCFVKSGYIENVVIWTISVSDPSVRKSPIFEAAMEPISDIRDKLRAEWQIARSSQSATISKLKRDLKAAERQAAKGDAQAAQDVERIRKEIDDASASVGDEPKKLWESDTTPERLAMTMSAEGDRLAIIGDEGDFFKAMTGSYGSGGGKITEILQKSYTGTPVSIGRVGRASIYMRRPLLTIGLAVQPRILESMPEKEELQGKGTLARVLWAVPKTSIGERVVWPDVPDFGQQGDYAAAIKQLFNVPEGKGGEAHMIPFDGPGSRAMRAHHEAIEPMLHPEKGELAPIGYWAGKHDGRTVRLAVLLHAAKNAALRWWEMPITAETVEAAVAIADWAIPHAFEAFRTLGVFQSSSIRNAIDVAKAVQAAPNCEILRNDLTCRFRHRMRADDIAAALNLLEERGAIRTAQMASTGGRNGGRRPQRVILNPTLKRLNLADEFPTMPDRKVSHSDDLD